METPPQTQIVEKENAPELMKTPEFSFPSASEHNTTSLMYRAKDNTWGDDESEIGKRIDDIYKNKALPQEVEHFFEKHIKRGKDGIDAETVYNLALSLERGDKKDLIIKRLQKEKGLSGLDEPRSDLALALKALKDSLPGSIKDSMNERAEREIKERYARLPDYRKRIKSLIDFYRLRSGSSDVKKIDILPSDPVLGEKTGAAFPMGDELTISSNINNPDNIEHEFLHTVINPIVEKLSSRLNERQKQRIVDMASHDLKHGQGYGEDYFSLLCEELIRTYNDVYSKGESLISYEVLLEEIGKLDKDGFRTLLGENPDFAEKCSSLGIAELDDLKSKSQEYFDVNHKNELREMAMNLYNGYAIAREKDQQLNFEEYLLDNFEI